MRSTFKTLTYLILFLVFTLESIQAAFLYFHPEAFNSFLTWLSIDIPRPVPSSEIALQSYLDATQSPAALLLSAFFVLKLIEKLFPKESIRHT